MFIMFLKLSFLTIYVQFSAELFFCCSTVECLRLHFIVLLRVFGYGVGMRITKWESHWNWNKTEIWEWDYKTPLLRRIKKELHVLVPL